MAPTVLRAGVRPDGTTFAGRPVFPDTSVGLDVPAPVHLGIGLDGGLFGARHRLSFVIGGDLPLVRRVRKGVVSSINGDAGTENVVAKYWRGTLMRASGGCQFVPNAVFSVIDDGELADDDPQPVGDRGARGLGAGGTALSRVRASPPSARTLSKAATIAAAAVVSPRCSSIIAALQI